MSKLPMNVDNDPEKLWKSNANPWESWNHSSYNPEEPSSVEENLAKKKTYSLFSHLKIQFVISVLIFLAILLATQLSNPYIEQGKVWIRTQLETSMDFVSIANYYENMFAGSPSFIPNFGKKSEQALAKHNQSVDIVSPIEQGILVHSFAELLNGVEIAGAVKANVHAVEKGRVIHVRDQQDSVIIQHADNRLSIYTRLGEVNVAVSDWVEAGAVIGKLAPIAGEDYSLLFMAIKQDDQYIDPLDVISVE